MDILNLYHISPNIWRYLFHYLFLYLKIAGWVTNSAEPGQTPHSAVCDLGLHSSSPSVNILMEIVVLQLLLDWLLEYTYTKIYFRLLSMWLYHWPMKSNHTLDGLTTCSWYEPTSCGLQTKLYSKTWTGHCVGTLAIWAEPDQMPQNMHLIRVCTIYLNYQVKG